MNLPAALALLVLVTVLAYITAENLVDSLEGMVHDHPNISKEWITLIIIPVISNAAEHATAVIVARKGKFDLAMSVAVGSCIQIALFVIPILVLVAWGMGKPLMLLFDPLETIVSLGYADYVDVSLIFLLCSSCSSPFYWSSSLLRTEGVTG
jgi:Ca2+:H+ antiporter